MHAVWRQRILPRVFPALAWFACIAAGFGPAGGIVAADETQAVETAKPLLDFSRPRTIVCLGDSVTGVYYHTGGVRAYPEMLEVALKKAYPAAEIKVWNAGVSGQSADHGIARLDRDVIGRKPDLVTVKFGLNDMTRFTTDQFRENIRTIVNRCREAKSQVVLCTPNAVLETSGRPTAKLELFCEAMRETARELGVPLCDLYAACERLRKKDAWAWRLTLSDEIHPNMDGHKLEARELCRVIGGKDASLDDVGPTPPLQKVLAKLRKGEPVKVLAMPPYDGLVGPALKQLAPDLKVEVTTWPVEGATLAEIERFSKEKVRAMKPDLVVLAVPREAKADSDEKFVTSYTWIMNWSLAFGYLEWDCLVVHPAMAQPGAKDAREDLVRKLVKAQDLWLIDRAPDETASAAEVFSRWIKNAVARM